MNHYLDIHPEVAEALRTDIDYYETGEIQPVPIYEQKKIDKYLFTILVFQSLREKVLKRIYAEVSLYVLAVHHA